jgi:hypothetical protein
MKRLALLVFMAALVTSCGSTAPEAPVVVAPTNAPAPTVAPTEVPSPVPLDKVDLSAILKAVTAFPKGLTGGEIGTGLSENAGQALGPGMINAAHQKVMHGADPSGQVDIVLYPDEAKLNAIYTNRKGIMMLISQQSGDKLEDVEDLGKVAIAMTTTVAGNGTYLDFTRCRALVEIYMVGDLVDTKTVTAYAKEIDAKLTEAVCR